MIEVKRLILVRHAMPEVDPAVPAERWRLGDEGRAAARSLAPAAPEWAYYVASDEPKARETLQEMAGGDGVTTDVGFREVDRPRVWSEDYRAIARAYVGGERHQGWESHTRVADRFDAAVVRHAAVAAAQQRLLVIGTHGLAATVWVASRVPVDSAAAFWEQLGFPDLVDVDLVAGTASHRAR